MRPLFDGPSEEVRMTEELLFVAPQEWVASAIWVEPSHMARDEHGGDVYRA